MDPNSNLPPMEPDEKHIKVIWKQIQDDFDKLEDINEMYSYLLQLTDDLSVCTSANCKVFPELYDLDLTRLDFEYPSIESFDAQNMNESQRKQFREKFRSFKIKAKAVKSKIFALKIENDKLEKRKLIDHQRFIRVIQEMAKTNQPFPMDFTKAVQGQIDQYGKTLDLEDSRISIERERFKRQMRVESSNENDSGK